MKNAAHWPRVSVVAPLVCQAIPGKPLQSGLWIGQILHGRSMEFRILRGEPIYPNSLHFRFAQSESIWWHFSLWMSTMDVLTFFSQLKSFQWPSFLTNGRSTQGLTWISLRTSSNSFFSCCTESSSMATLGAVWQRVGSFAMKCYGSTEVSPKSLQVTESHLYRSDSWADLKS